MFPPLHSSSVSQGQKFGGCPAFKQASIEPTPESPLPSASTAYALIVELRISVVESTKSTNAKLLILYFIVLCISILHTSSIKDTFVSHDLFTLFQLFLGMKIKL